MPSAIAAGLLLALGLAQTSAAPTVAEARQSLVGQWQGKLEYRDYQADRWFGLPVTVTVRDGGDGVTLIRTADYDDGPATGIVRITTIAMLEATGASETSATFRKGRAVELSTARLQINPASTGADQWTMTEMIDGRDDDRPARIRITTTRSGTRLVSLKEVDFSDDSKTEWLIRNRTTLERKG